jgi:hypothetical protein
VTNLEKANFEGANIKWAINLSIKQLSEAKALYTIKLGEDFLCH